MIEADDYSRKPVPRQNTYTAVHVALIVIGTTIGVPVFLVSAQIGGSLGLAQAIPAFLAGSTALCILGCLTSLAGVRSRYSTYMLTAFAFGRVGAKFVNFVMALTVIGWYGVTGTVFGQAADMIVQLLYGWRIPTSIYVVTGSLLMIGVAVSGFKGLDKLAIVIVPAMLLFMLYTAGVTYQDIGSWQDATPFGERLSFSAATSAVVGSYIVGVVIQPDYSRFALDDRHALWAILIALGISFPLVQTLASIPSIATGELHLIRIMAVLGIGIPAFLLLLLGSWSSNVVSLYSGSLSLATIFTRTSLWKITATVGVIGTAVAFTKTQDYFITFLTVLGTTIPPIASIYIIDVLLVRRGKCDADDLLAEPAVDANAFIAWLAGAGTAYLAAADMVNLSTIASVDSIVISSITYLLLNLGKIKCRPTGRPTRKSP